MTMIHLLSIDTTVWRDIFTPDICSKTFLFLLLACTTASLSNTGIGKYYQLQH